VGYLWRGAVLAAVALMAGMIGVGCAETRPQSHGEVAAPAEMALDFDLTDEQIAQLEGVVAKGQLAWRLNALRTAQAGLRAAAEVKAIGNETFPSEVQALIADDSRWQVQEAKEGRATARGCGDKITATVHLKRSEGRGGVRVWLVAKIDLVARFSASSGADAKE